MFRKILVACCGALLLAACARGVAMVPGDPAIPFDFVEDIQGYARPREVPVKFQHLVDWYTGTEPVVLLLAPGGTRACAITTAEATKVLVGRPYRCRWRGAR